MISVTEELHFKFVFCLNLASPSVWLVAILLSSGDIVQSPSSQKFLLDRASE